LTTASRRELATFEALARKLVGARVEVVAASALAATVAARRSTGTTAIVMVYAGNPVGAGLIASLARPGGGNITGTMNLPLGGKRVQLIREVVPRVAKLAILANPTNAGARSRRNTRAGRSAR